MNLLYWFESIRTPAVTAVLEKITYCGGELVLLAVGIIVFWCISKPCGYYVLSMGFLGTTINQFVKILCRVPRPWVQDPNFTIVESARADAGGYSFPSGHTQNVFAAFGAPARYLKKAAVVIPCVIIILLTALSRMYLGVHTPYDVGFSILLGLILLFLLYPIFRDMEERPDNVYVFMILMLLISIAYVVYLECSTFPADMDADNVAEAFKNGYITLGCSLGLPIVFHLDRTKLKFDTRAVWWAQILKVVLGFVLIMAIRMGLKPPLEALFHGHAAANGIRYFCMVIFAGSIWPLTFRWFGKLGKKKA